MHVQVRYRHQAIESQALALLDVSQSAVMASGC